MTDDINTHDLIVDFGKHKGERWTRVPASYLRWLVNDANPEFRGSVERKRIAQAELDRRGISTADRKVEISGHAIDSASLRIRKIWHEDRGQDEGLHAWLLRICEEALAAHEPDDEGRIHWKGVRLVFLEGNLYPTLKTVTRMKRRQDASGADRPNGRTVADNQADAAAPAHPSAPPGGRPAEAPSDESPPWDENACESCNEPAVANGRCEFHDQVMSDGKP